MVRFWVCIFKAVKVGFPNELDERCKRTREIEVEGMVLGFGNWK